MGRTSRQRGEEEVREGESDEAMKAEEIRKIIEDLEDPHILLRNLVEMGGGKVKPAKGVKKGQRA